MKYKLFGLEQRTAIKEGLFRKGLRRRYKLIGQIMSINRELDKDAIQDLTFTFTRNIPKSVKDEMEMYLQAGGQVSQQTLMSIVSFIDNPQQEMERIENEEDAQLQKSDERMYNLEGMDNQTNIKE
ncbi:SPP1 family phage portal protein [Staphylococcus hominis]